jgi:hypothetical protein
LHALAQVADHVCVGELLYTGLACGHTQGLLTARARTETAAAVHEAIAELLQKL